MFISISLLLILLFTLGFWIVKESKIHLSIKILTISTFFFFGAIFCNMWESSMGWAAKDKYLPEIVAIRHVVIKEPNQELQLKGAIYLLLEVQPTKYDSFILNLFAYKTTESEPRLFHIPYNRQLHEQLQKGVIPKNRKGQIVYGKLKNIGKNKDGEDGKENKGKNKDGRPRNIDNNKKQGNDGESLETEWQFYELPPNYFLQKN